MNNKIHTTQRRRRRVDESGIGQRVVLLQNFVCEEQGVAIPAVSHGTVMGVSGISDCIVLFDLPAVRAVISSHQLALLEGSPLW